VVDVVDEAVERRDALDQALFHLPPFVRRDDARESGRTGIRRSVPAPSSSFAPYTAKVMPTRRKIISASSRRDSHHGVLRLPASQLLA
jgi:hypothetical protein